MSAYLRYGDARLAIGSYQPPGASHSPNVNGEHSESNSNSSNCLCITGPEHDYKGTKGIYFGGRIVYCSGQLFYQLRTLVLILGSVFLYFVIVFPEFLPDTAQWSRSFLFLSHCIEFAIMLASFFIAAFSNPGIIPRVQLYDPCLMAHLDSKYKTPKTRYIKINDVNVTQQWCWTCNIYRPPRSKHCGCCNNCVLKFDHHCPFLGNCVALNNYRFYLAFIYSIIFFACQSLYVLTALSNRASSSKHGFQDQAPEGSLSLWQLQILTVYCCSILGGVGYLAVYHLKLVFWNLTTNEEVKKPYTIQDDNTMVKKHVSPFDYGLAWNCAQIWCFPGRVLAPLDDEPIECSYVPFGEGAVSQDEEGGSECSDRPD